MPLAYVEPKHTPINIAIDGPAGAGKSTVARLVAQELGYVYIDTGAMYRSVAWKVLKAGIPVQDSEAIIELARQTDIKLLPGGDKQKVLIDGEDRTEEIRSLQVSRIVSHISQIEGVREHLVRLQQWLAARKGVVMDGRDIGTRVLPDAELKIFLTASVRTRAMRRYAEIGRQQDITLEQLEREIAERDRMDEQRDTSPLVCAEDAVRIDSSDLSAEEVVGRIIELCRAYIGGDR